ELRPTSKIHKYYPDEPADDYLHVIVERPASCEYCHFSQRQAITFSHVAHTLADLAVASATQQLEALSLVTSSSSTKTIICELAGVYRLLRLHQVERVFVNS